MRTGLFTVILLIGILGAGLTEARGVLLKVESEGFSDAYLTLGNYLFKQGSLEQSERAFLKSIEIYESEDAVHNLGVVYYEQARYSDAEREFRRAIELNPFYVEAQNSLAMLLFEQADYEGAAKHFEEVLKNDPLNGQAHFNLGVSLSNNFRKGFGSIDDLRLAKRHFANSKKLNPFNEHAETNEKIISNVLDSVDRSI